MTFAIDDIVLALSPWSSSHAQCQMARRDMWMSIALSASMNDTPWCSPSVLPNDMR